MRGALGCALVALLLISSLSASGKCPPDCRPIDRGVESSQQRLAEWGYPLGPIDGIVGPKTDLAIERFQRDHGLPITRTLDDGTVEKLWSAAGAR